MENGLHSLPKLPSPSVVVANGSSRKGILKDSPQRPNCTQKTATIGNRQKMTSQVRSVSFENGLDDDDEDFYDETCTRDVNDNEGDDDDKRKERGGRNSITFLRYAKKMAFEKRSSIFAHAGLCICL